MSAHALFVFLRHQYEVDDPYEDEPEFDPTPWPEAPTPWPGEIDSPELSELEEAEDSEDEVVRDSS